MSEMELGLPFDIHGGATDLIFPHHENERAQSEAATGKRFVKYWMHGGLLQVNSEKMSKSLGNFLLLKDVLESYPVPVIRLLMLQTHYRSPLDFSTERLDEARTAYERLENMVREVWWIRSRPAPGSGASEPERAALVSAVWEARSRFDAEMDDDFNSAGALGVLFDLVRVANGFRSGAGSDLGPADLDVLGQAEGVVVELLGVLGVTIPVTGSATQSFALTQTVHGQAADPLVELAARLAGYTGTDSAGAEAALLEAREAARRERDWPAADAIRDGLGEAGRRIEDTPSGPRIVPARG
jgi:cysteinyl-tRNA synthetase